MAKKKYWYSTKIGDKERVCRFRHWKEEFKDADTGESIFITRSLLIKVNGKKMRFYSNDEVKRMTPAQKKEVFDY